MDYETIKALSRQTGQRVGDLIVLAPQNDPFYTGTPNDWALAEWFAGLWQEFGYRDGVHLRRIHYQVVSQDPPVFLPNGKPYENTEECWGVLNLASKAARYLRLVDPGAFVDRRNDGVVEFAKHGVSDPQVYLNGYVGRYSYGFPDFPDLPGYQVSGFRGEQAYHLEVWCEKSTMNDVLLPLCESYGANLQVGSGELSITSTLALVQRLDRANKPARIFYVSDFDPAGQSMPVAVSRKMEYFLHTLGLDLDVRLFPVVLTAEQVRFFHLPRTPIKETERRRVGFEERYGEGAVELDALEALYPGKLAEVLRSCMESYYDAELEQRVRLTEAMLVAELKMVADGVLGSYKPDIEALRQSYKELHQEFAGRMEGYGRRLASLWQAMRDSLRTNAPDLDDYPVPLAVEADEIEDGLFNSQRDYLEQVAAYKAFQGKLVEADV
jgi:hypothetical protein